MILMAQNQKGQGTKWGAGGGPKKIYVFLLLIIEEQLSEVVLTSLAVVNVLRGFLYFLAWVLWRVNQFSLQIPLQTGDGYN